MLTKPIPYADIDAVPDFLSRMSVEITAKQADKLPLVASRMRPGSEVFVALIDPADREGQIAAVAAIRKHGLKPVPHVPARFVRDRDDLARRLEAFAKEGRAERVLVLGGGAKHPLGSYKAAIELLETGLLQANGITGFGMAGHPEGNADITSTLGEEALIEALKLKQAYAKDHGMSAFIATQFLFAAEPVAAWAETLKAHGIALPIAVGIPGPATIKTLVRYAQMCGVGQSARFIRKQALNVSKLLTVNAPDAFVADLARLAQERPELHIARPHFYPFGGFDKLFDWVGRSE
jgi:methylenetetrahydrofolate reductase (NADPH)